jgi:hypothetical protein
MIDIVPLTFSNNNGMKLQVRREERKKKRKKGRKEGRN